MEINDHVINLVDSKQLPYEPMYRLGLVKLETSKTFIKTNLAKGFIGPSKSPEDALILFIRKSNSTPCQYINYQVLKNLIIKNWYPFL